MLQAQQILHDRYQLIQLLGQVLGRQTWQAVDLHHTPPVPVIVKVMAFAEQSNWEPIKLFEREAKVLQHLQHPHIPHYQDFFSIEDHVFYFVMVQEFIAGTTLKDLLNQGHRFSQEQLDQIATEVLEILIYLHELHPPVFHRDIKPSNLIWGEDQHVYLIDFGAVQDKAATEGVTFTVVGTYGYAPIEQFGGRTVPSSDLYALGATLIHLATGVSPAHLPQKQLCIQFADKTKLSANRVKWLEKLTAPDMARRFSNARDALGSLEMIQESSEYSLTVPQHLRLSQPDTNQSSVNGKNPVIATVVINVIGLGSVVWLVFYPTSFPITPPPIKEGTSSVQELETPLPSPNVSPSPERVHGCRALIYPGSVLFNIHTWSDNPTVVWRYLLQVKTVSGNKWSGTFGDGLPVYGTIDDSQFTMKRDTWNQEWSGTCSDDDITGTMSSPVASPTGKFSFQRTN